MLHGRSGAGLSGATPLSYRELQAWREEMDIGKLHPFEVSGLVILEAAIRHTDDDESEEDDPEVIEEPKKGWPQRAPGRENVDPLRIKE